MKVKELVAELQKLPQEMSVNVFDYRKNLFRGGGYNCSDGIESVKGAYVAPDDETVKLMREDGEEINQWVAIEYTNDDYNKDFGYSEEIIEAIKEESIYFANWLQKLSPSEKVSVWSKDGQYSGMFTMDNEQLYDKFKRKN